MALETLTSSAALHLSIPERNPMPPRSKRLFTRSLLGAVLVFFLMPFLTLTCGGQPLITLNGVNLATGRTLESKNPFSGDVQKREIQPEPMVALAALAAVAALVLAFLAEAGSTRTGSMVASGLCALFLLATKFKVDGDVMKQGEGMVQAQWELGFWLALLAAIAATALYFIPDQAIAEAPQKAEPASD